MFFSHQFKDLAPTSLVTIDIGNTQTSVALFEGATLKAFERFSSKSLHTAESELISFCKKCAAFIEGVPLIAMSSVVPSVAALLKERIYNEFAKKEIFEISYQKKLPFEVCYETPETLGNDRLALCAAAAEIFPNQAVIVIDFGTAITYDILSSKQKYLGGLILAGTSLSARALNDHTAQLSAIELQQETKVIGTNTNACLSKGLFWGTVAQTEGLILKLKAALINEHAEKDVKVLITGGNSGILATTTQGIDLRDEFAVHKGIRFIAALNARPERHR